MASFTDQLVGFNPYIPQLPVDDYVRVGMIKQQQYNEGVQKVQSYIDSVAGLDVIKPEQKEYLQQRVGQLQGEVSKVLSADFSNQQIVNSVGTLTNKIAGDPIVQNAVYSTQRYRSQLGEMKEAQQKGVSSPSNEYVFQKGVNDWLSDGDVKSSYTGEYERYTDTKKPILEAINALKPGENITDIPYETDAQGNYILDSHGGRKIAYATLREKLEGVPEARVKEAIEAAMTPQMRRQFQIDGMYNYRGYDKQALKQMTDASYQHRLGQLNEIMQGLTNDLNTAQNNPRRKAAIQAQIDQYRLGGKDMLNQYKQDVEFLDKNPDQYKGELHTQDEIAKYTLGYSWSKHSLTYENNPIFQGVMKEKEYDLNWDKYVETKNYHEGELAIRAKAEETRELAVRLKYGLASGQGGGAFRLDQAVLAPIPQEELEKVNLSTLQDSIDNMSKDLDAQKMRAISGMEGGTNWVENSDGRLIYKDQASKDAAETALKTAKTAYDKDPSSVSPALQTYFSTSANQDAVVQNYKATAAKIVASADQKYGTQNLTKGLSPLVYTTKTGEKITMTPQELLDLGEKMRNQDAKYPTKEQVDPTTGTPQGSYMSMEDIQAYYAPFSQKEKEILGAFEEGDKQIQPFESALERLRSQPARAMLDKRNEYIQTEARRAYTQGQGANFPIVAYKAADATRAKAAFINIINDQRGEGKSNTNPNFDEGDISKMLDEKNMKGTTYSLHSKPDGSFSVRFSNTSVTDKPREMDITADQAGKWFGTFVNEFKPIEHAINLSKYNGIGATTDVRGGGKTTAYNIPESTVLNKYSVKYHVEEPQDGQYQLKLYIYDKKGKTWLPETYANFGGQLLNQQQIMAAVSNLTDSEVDRILKKKPGTVAGQLNTGPDPYVSPIIGGGTPSTDLQDLQDLQDQQDEDNSDNE